MPGHQSPWIPPYATIPLDYVDGDTSEVVRGLRYELVKLCREKHIHQKAITPYTSRWGYGFVLQEGSFADRNHVTLYTGDGWTRFPFKAGAARYRTLMDLGGYAELMEAIELDYPHGSLTAELTATLGQILQLWAGAKQSGKNTLDLRPVDEIVAARLNPFVEAWRKARQDDDEDGI